MKETNGIATDTKKPTTFRQREFFNQNAHRWDSMCQHNPEKIEKIMSLLQIQGHERILDVGTGTGVLIPFYIKHLSSGTVTAFDYSENMVKIAKNKFPKKHYQNIDFRLEDLHNIEYNSEYDIAMCYSCFPHFPDKKQAINHLAKALKTGGSLVVAHSDSREKINHMHGESGEAVQEDSLPPMNELKKMVAENGLNPTFEQDDAEYYILISTKKEPKTIPKI